MISLSYTYMYELNNLVFSFNACKTMIRLAIADWRLAIGNYFSTNQNKANTDCFTLID